MFLLLLITVLARLPGLNSIILITADLQCSDDQVPFPNNVCKPFDESYEDAYKVLFDHLPSWDRSNADSLGFHNVSGPDVDGLDEGIATLGINISLATKQKYFWAANVSEEIYYEFVVTYCHVNEARNNWRPFLTEVVDRILTDHLDIEDTSLTMEDIVRVINTNLWVRHYLGNDVVFKSSQTPLIYDPMSTIVYGYASCTGVSILFADALRAAGVPVRLAGTPAWNGVSSHGNHNWIEVFDHQSQQWHFIEATPAGGGMGVYYSLFEWGELGKDQEFSSILLRGKIKFLGRINYTPMGGGETLRDPCDKWFCTPAKMSGGTEVFAARWEEDGEGTIYPMAWDRNNREIPGVNRTQYYQTVCNAC